jgi:hypothetical protein
MRPQTVANNRRAHLTTTITTACAGILDLIDVDRPERVHTRHPSRNERDATDRKDGRFQPTPTGPSRRADVSRPVEAAVLAWERKVAHALADLQTLTSRWDDIRPAPPPPAGGSSAAARRHVIDLSVWLDTTAAEACDRLERVDGEAWQHWRERTDLMLRQATRVARRWAADRPHARPCRCVPACGLWVLRGEGATHQACRKARSRKPTREDAA